MSGYLAIIAIRLRTKFNPGYIFQTKNFSRWKCLDNHIAELFFRFITPTILQCILKRVLRIFTQCTRSYFYILLIKQSCHITGNQTVLRHNLRIHPDTHSIVATHHIDISYTCDTRQARLNIYLEIVIYKILVITVIFAIKSQNLYHTVLAFLYRNTNLGNFGWQHSFCFRHTVFRINGCHIRIGSLRKVNRNGSRTIIGSSRSHVCHVLHTIYSLFQRSNHTFLHSFSIGSGVSCRNRNSRRSNIRILFHRQIGKPDNSQHQYEYRNHT